MIVIRLELNEEYVWMFHADIKFNRLYDSIGEYFNNLAYQKQD